MADGGEQAVQKHDTPPPGPALRKSDMESSRL
jgi:hypothetical protein